MTLVWSAIGLKSLKESVEFSGITETEESLIGSIIYVSAVVIDKAYK